MSPDGRVEQLLELILNTGQTPHEVCADAPELLEEVQERWHDLTHVEAALQALFPRSQDVPQLIQFQARQRDAALVEIPGYDVTEVLGSGGMGIVYRGVQRKLDRVVAIKMLLADRYATRPQNAALSREAQSVAALRHPNIVQVYDVGEVDGCPYFTMEYVDGGTLAARLHGAPTSVTSAMEAMVTIARAVEAAHRAGIVHRDLKPANVLLTVDGTPKVSDFGIALRVQRDGDGAAAQRGARFGTPSYMAPEQADDERGAVGPLSDVYALGAILYEMLTGRPPFRAESTAETERQLLTQDPVPPSRLNGRVPRDLETVCLKCLRKDPSRRYASAAALADDIERVQRKEPITARRVSIVERGVKWVRRNTATTAALAATMLLLASASAALLWHASSRAAMNRAAEMDLREAVRFLQQSDWPAANRAIDRAALRVDEGGSSDLRTRLDRARRDAALAARLVAIRLSDPGELTPVGVSDEKAADQYAAALREAGLFDPGDEPDEVARRVRESNIRAILSIALDDWALSSIKGRQNEWLREVIKRTSPGLSGWRDRALDPQTYDDPALRNALMSDAPITRESLPLLNSVGRTLKNAREDVVGFLTRIQQAYPDDFWANEGLATALFDAGRPAEAIAYERAALALRPNAAWVHFNLAGALARAGDRAGAESHFRKAAELAPGDSLPHAQLGYLYMTSDRPAQALVEWQEAIRLKPAEGRFHVYAGDTYLLLAREQDAVSSYRRALELDPRHLDAQVGLRRVFVRQGQTDAAIERWRQSMDQHPDDEPAWDGFAEYCLYVGRTDDFRQARVRLLAIFGDSREPRVCEHIGRACLLLAPPSDEELRRATAMIDRALAIAQSSPDIRWTVPYFQVAKGLAEYRAGNDEAALSILTGDPAKVLRPAPQLIAAMARFRLGQTDEAREALAVAVASFDWSPQRAHGDDDREVWIYHILRREAEGLINSPR